MGRSGLSGTWTYTLNDAGQLTSQTNPFSETTSYTLDDDGRVTLQTHANGTKVVPSYDSGRGWLSGLTHKKSDNTVLAAYSYSRDAAGLVTGESQTGAYSVSYSYDDAYQLTREQRTGSAAYDYTYTYDAAGNRLSKYDGTTTESYTYDDADKLLTAGSKSYGYDSAGNLTSVTVGSQVTSLTWDYAGRLVGITYPNTSTNSFTYNDLGQRTTKVDSAGTLTSLYDGSRVVADSRADYTNGGLTGLVSERSSGTTLTYHGDQLGSTRGLTNGSQTVTTSRERDAWGNVVASSGTLAGPFGFVGGQGYQQDSDSGLMRLGARYYDASVGRFISRDPSRYGGGDPNLYRYCSNSPTNGTDPSGLIIQAIALPILAIAVLVVAVGYVLTRPEGRQALSHLVSATGQLIQDGWNAASRGIGALFNQDGHRSPSTGNCSDDAFDEWARPGASGDIWTLDGPLVGPNGETWEKHDVFVEGESVVDKMLHPEGPVSLDDWRKGWGEQFSDDRFTPWGPSEWENYGADKWGRVAQDMFKGDGPW